MILKVGRGRCRPRYLKIANQLRNVFVNGFPAALVPAQDPVCHKYGLQAGNESMKTQAL